MTSTEHEPKSTEIHHHTPEKKKGLTKTQKIIGSTIILVALVSGGLAYNIYQNNQAATSSETEKKPSIPDEARSFVSEFGDRYLSTSTAVSTYYAEKAYESQNNDKGSVISNDYIDTYEAGGLVDTTELGFKGYSLPLDIAYDQETSMKVFNEYTAPMLNRYMNLVARNTDAVDIIDSQFYDDCIGIDPKDINPLNQQAIIAGQNFMSMAKSVVAKYGSNANYSVALASNKETSTDSTFFFDALTTSSNISGQNSGFEQYVDLLIDIDTYNGKKKSHESKTTDVYLTFSRIQLVTSPSSAPATYLPTYSSSSQIAIGLKVAQH